MANECVAKCKEIEEKKDHYLKFVFPQKVSFELYIKSKNTEISEDELAKLIECILTQQKIMMELSSFLVPIYNLAIEKSKTNAYLADIQRLMIVLQIQNKSINASVNEIKKMKDKNNEIINTEKKEEIEDINKK